MFYLYMKIQRHTNRTYKLLKIIGNIEIYSFWLSDECNKQPNQIILKIETKQIRKIFQ